MLSGYEFFKIYHSLHLHFTSAKYDVFKYNGKTNASYSAFERRRDKLRFDSFANKLIGKHKAGQFCIANFVYGSNHFIYEPYDDGYDVYLHWKKIRESVTHTFEKDIGYLNRIVENKPGINLFEKTKSGNHPPLLQVGLAQMVGVETLCIIDKEHREFFDNWMLICDNDPMVTEKLLMWKKYQPFVNYDEDKIKPILQGALF
jgi:hypothetical protein